MVILLMEPRTHEAPPAVAMTRRTGDALGRWHTSGNVLLTGSQDGTVWMWDASAGTCMQVRYSTVTVITLHDTTLYDTRGYNAFESQG